MLSAVREGYTFVGWKVKSSDNDSWGTDKVYSVGTYTGLSGNVNLEAQWTANTYTVAYHGNGSTSGSMASSSHTYGVAKALTANGFTKTGYTFAGWNTAADGSGTQYNDQQSVENLTTEANGMVTLYAQWQRNTTSLTISVSGGVGYTFLFRIQGDGTDLMIAVKGDSSVTIHGLSIGTEYTVTEISGWSWRHDVTGATDIALTEASTLKFEATENQTGWLGGESG